MLNERSYDDNALKKQNHVFNLPYGISYNYPVFNYRLIFTYAWLKEQITIQLTHNTLGGIRVHLCFVNVTTKLISIPFELNKSIYKINGFVLSHISADPSQPSGGPVTHLASWSRNTQLCANNQPYLALGIRVFSDVPHANVTTERLRKSAPPRLTSSLIHQTSNNLPECVHREPGHKVIAWLSSAL
jgi:hypothetical protein